MAEQAAFGYLSETVRRGSAMKIARHAKILELIENYDIETQDELA